MRPHALPLAVLLGTCLALTPPTRAADPAPATRPAIAVAALPSVPDADRLADLIRGLTQGKNPQCAPQDEFERGVGRSDLAALLRELGHRDAARREAEQMDRVVATLPADDRAALQDSLAYALAAGGLYRRAFEVAGRLEEADGRSRTLGAIAEYIVDDGPAAAGEGPAVRGEIEKQLSRELADGTLTGPAAAYARSWQWARAALAAGSAEPGDGLAPPPLKDPAERAAAFAFVGFDRLYHLDLSPAAARPWAEAAASETETLPAAPPPPNPAEPPSFSDPIDAAREATTSLLGSLDDTGRAEQIARRITDPTAAGRALADLAGDHLRAGRAAEYRRLTADGRRTVTRAYAAAPDGKETAASALGFTLAYAAAGSPEFQVVDPAAAPGDIGMADYWSALTACRAAASGLLDRATLARAARRP